MFCRNTVEGTNAGIWHCCVSLTVLNFILIADYTLLHGITAMSQDFALPNTNIIVSNIDIDNSLLMGN